MTETRSRTGLLSRLTAPLAKAARRVVSRTPVEEDEVRRMMEAALARAAEGQARLTEDDFRLFTDQLARQEDGAFQVKLHIISLVEFREAVGDKWGRLSEKVLMIAEGVINMHLGAGNVFCRQGLDLFVLLFRTCDEAEGRRRAILIAQELGTRLVGDQFVGAEVPLALAAEVSADEGLSEDGTINMDAVNRAVGEMRSIIAAEAAKAEGPRAWMRPGTAPQEEAGGPRRHLLPGAPPEPAAAPDDRPPIEVLPEGETRQPEEPGWKKLELERKAAKPAPQWVALEKAARPAAPHLDPEPDDGAQPLPADARLALVWRPTWMAAGEVIGAYEARIQRTDIPGAPALEGTHAYAAGDEPGARTLDRFRIAAAIRDFRASETAGNKSNVVIPIHWLTLTADNRMDFLAPFADLTRQSRADHVVIEVFGVPEDVKPITLGGVIERTLDLCRTVALRTRLNDPRAAQARDCGAGMVSVDVAELIGANRVTDDELLEALRAFHAQAAKARLGACVWGVRHRKVVVGAVQAGFAMLNGPALMKDLPKPARQLPAPKSRFVLT